MNEAHVQHAVGFVQHQNFNGRQIDVPLPGQVQQAARRGHENVDAFFDALDLRVHAHAAKNDGGFELEMLTVSTHGLLNLRGQLPRGSQHQGADGPGRAFGWSGGRFGQAMQHGQSKACGFARAGLRASEQIVPRQHGGNGLFLNGGRGGVALFLHGLHNGRRQFQIFKVHSESGAPRFLEKGASRTSPICRAIMCIDERGRPVESRLVGQIGKGGPFLISPQPQQTAALRQTGGPRRTE